jgi:hypothetical protein
LLVVAKTAILDEHEANAETNRPNSAPSTGHGESSNAAEQVKVCSLIHLCSSRLLFSIKRLGDFPFSRLEAVHYGRGMA